MPSPGFRFAIDRGGTFTDIFAVLPGGRGVRVMKLLSEDPKNYSDAPTEGMRRIISETLGKTVALPLDASLIEDIRMGTTVATNALLERKGTQTALLLNEGFRDLLAIGDQTRPDLFDLKALKPQCLYAKVVEIKERLIPHLEGEESKEIRTSPTTGETFVLQEPLDVTSLRIKLSEIKEEGIDSLAVALLHSYAYPEHERIIEDIATKEFGFKHVSLSSRVSPMIKIVPRGSTAVLDAYLTPILQNYLSQFASNFKIAPGKSLPVLFMRSDGGLTAMDHFTGCQAILSGPAGGVVGYAQTAPSINDLPLVGFDMGGTSTDVSRYHGSYEHIHESLVAGVQIQTSQLDINTVAAGGGSILSFRSGLFLAGPESAGAHPGPACYRKGGPLTVTDANLILGRVLPQYFPHIFGPSENEPLDKEASKRRFKSLTKEINESLGGSLSVEETALGFIRVANESMCRPIRSLTQAKGFDTSKHALSCFGGAGGQHACAVARSLGMGRVYLHKYAGILSAYGMALADVVHEEQAPCSREYTHEQFKEVEKLSDSLRSSVYEYLRCRGFPSERIETQLYLNMRYKGTESALMIRVPGSIQEAEDLFLARYKTEFGFLLQDAVILVEDVRIRGVGKTDVYSEDDITTTPSSKSPEHEETLPIYFEGGFKDSKVYLFKKLLPGHELVGPCILIDDLSTILIEPDCLGTIDKKGNLSIHLKSIQNASVIGTQLDSIQLSIFSHRFMSIAEQMGRILRRTSISTNIKERLDFSCALFGPDGGLVSNAPHIPVHLGAMQDTVKYQIKVANFSPGDVLLANHPLAGGSHLPDLTVITPVFVPGGESPVFFTANRGHHADIGGSTPGSMPPHSKSLLEEGAQFMSFKLVQNGEFNEGDLIDKFNEPGKYPGCSGSRSLRDNISDLKAQIASNQKGIALVQELIAYYGLDVVQSYMKYIQSNAELSVRDTLKALGSKLGSSSSKIVELKAEDFMDDGSRIRLSVRINMAEGSAIFDFTGSGTQVWGNINTPKAVTYSAVIYSLRCLVGHDIPLNQGCLSPIDIIIPPGSLLDPSGDAAVVGGNVLTSQRIVDVILSAFQAAANSQGCCNNVTFGDGSFGYYETVAGGSGAGPGWHGSSGVHVHITNTRLTDPEILEKRYPVTLTSFSLAPGTGGKGEFSGGNGISRAIRFRKNLTLSILTERRVFAPNGICGGGPGSPGMNTLLRGEQVINLGGKCSIPVGPGDVFLMRTPGGGGYGHPPKEEESIPPPKKMQRTYAKGGVGSVAQYDATQLSA